MNIITKNHYPVELLVQLKVKRLLSLFSLFTPTADADARRFFYAFCRRLVDPFPAN